MTPAAPAAFSAPGAIGWILLLLATAWSLRAVWLQVTPAIGWKWWLLAAAAVLWFRWPLLWVPHQMNPDETQLIAGAITLRHDPVFWRSVDGGTAGPLDFYPLLPAAWADGTTNYAVARLVALVVVLGTIVFAGETLTLLAGAAAAQVAVLPALAFTALTTNPDFTHYSTELMPALLIAGAGYAAARHRRTPASGWLWFIGLLLGGVLWAKLQAAPIAAALWIFVASSEWRAGRTRSLIPLVTGALLPALTFLGMAVLTGQEEHLIVPYLLQNFAYVRAPQFSWTDVAALQWNNALADGCLGTWLAGAGLFGLIAFVRLRAVPTALRNATLAAALLLAVGVFSALAPRRPSAHHLQLIVLPFIWLTGAALALWWPRDNTSDPARPRLLVAGLFLACGLVPQLAWRATHADPFAEFNFSGVSPARRALVAQVRSFSSPGEPLAVWGWRCSLYVEANRPQATRQAQTEAQIYPGPLRPYFLRRYLEDFQAANPPVFADAVGPGNFAFESPRFAYETFPPLRTWVHDRYTLVATLDGTRLFVRNDRLMQLRKAPPP